uniref:Uncharacterized protein n=1 Tax=Anopheles merus TaxID=30066 RepID=A0A182UXR7_ANOME
MSLTASQGSGGHWRKAQTDLHVSGAGRCQPLRIIGGDLKPPDDEAEYFDQFLKTKTTAEPEFAFEETTTGNGTEESPYEVRHTPTKSILGFMGDNDEVNLLENITDYRLLVEQLFPQRAITAGPSEQDNAFETRLIVSCSNFGNFSNSRERWWHVAIANCDEKHHTRKKTKRPPEAMCPSRKRAVPLEPRKGDLGQITRNKRNKRTGQSSKVSVVRFWGLCEGLGDANMAKGESSSPSVSELSL